MNDASYRTGEVVVVGDEVFVSPGVSGRVTEISADIDWRTGKIGELGVYVETEAIGLVWVALSDEDLVFVKHLSV